MNIDYLRYASGGAILEKNYHKDDGAACRVVAEGEA